MTSSAEQMLANQATPMGIRGAVSAKDVADYVKFLQEKDVLTQMVNDSFHIMEWAYQGVDQDELQRLVLHHRHKEEDLLADMLQNVFLVGEGSSTFIASVPSKQCLCQCGLALRASSRWQEHDENGRGCSRCNRPGCRNRGFGLWLWCFSPPGSGRRRSGFLGSWLRCSAQNVRWLQRANGECCEWFSLVLSREQGPHWDFGSWWYQAEAEDKLIKVLRQEPTGTTGSSAVDEEVLFYEAEAEPAISPHMGCCDRAAKANSTVRRSENGAWFKKCSCWDWHCALVCLCLLSPPANGSAHLSPSDPRRKRSRKPSKPTWRGQGVPQVCRHGDLGMVSCSRIRGSMLPTARLVEVGVGAGVNFPYFKQAGVKEVDAVSNGPWASWGCGWKMWHYPGRF